ncbi:hypothetical protein [Tenuibacillus multivorans]|uniref:Uncharacterized protein n=1 Tax=Tenuibacillus multivorans TaxID=237069 RepID=A0A1H0BU81_9BACI|nr:hypothetical protein [Tenuibacillus multivorans]GEL77032.1 hypothetical protein TMU01_12670 [Tenuibacillus multivorans]SDN49204.1 hypothetical protein SAMN05216498_2390 [Tenuibacillus multivorans]
MINFNRAREKFLSDDDPNELLEFALDTYDYLNSKDSNSYSKEDATLCSLMYLALEILEKDFEIGVENIGVKEKELNKLMNQYRTGILRGGIIKEGFYTFTHTKENAKYNRQYMTRLVRVRDKETIFLIALDPSILEEQIYGALIDHISKDFEKLLNKLEKMYNNNTERIGD